MVIVARSRSVHGPWENSPHNPWSAPGNAEAWWSRGHATSLVEGPTDDWWMLYHGYENGFRTLGRQTCSSRSTGPTTAGQSPRPTTSAAHSPHLRMPRRSARRGSFHDDFSTLRLGERWTFHAPAPGEVDRPGRTTASAPRAKGTGPADTSPLCVLTGDHSYEVEVDIELGSGSTEAGLLLFFNDRLFCGMGIDGERMLS